MILEFFGTGSARQTASVPVVKVVVAVALAAVLVILTACTTGTSGPTPSSPATQQGSASQIETGPHLSFKETEHDFGQIDYNKKMEYRWAVTNTGAGVLHVGEIKAEPLDPSSCA